MYLHVGTVSPVVSEWVADAYCHTNFWLPWEESRLRLLIAQESFASPQEAVPSSLWARDRKMSAQSASASAARATAASEQQDRNGKEK